jgi:hypothetical protein
MTEALETRQRRIEREEARYKQSLYQGGLRSFKIFPVFSVDTK